MAYATLADMTARFGEEELVHLSAAPGGLDGPPVAAKVTVALNDATALVDSYLRRRYLVPLVAPIPAEIVRAACVLARFDLAHGDQREPTEQMRLARKEVIAWLERLSEGSSLLDGVPTAPATGGARMQDRPRDFASTVFGGW